MARDECVTMSHQPQSQSQLIGYTPSSSSSAHPNSSRSKHWDKSDRKKSLSPTVSKDNIELSEERDEHEQLLEFEANEKEKQRTKKTVRGGAGAAVAFGIGGFMLASGPIGAVVGVGIAGGAAALSLVRGGSGPSKKQVEDKQLQSDAADDPLAVKPPTEKRVKLILKWASLKLDESNTQESLLRMFDQVITQLAPWAVRAQELPKESRKMICYFGRLMEAEKVYTFFTITNRAWLASWEMGSVDSASAHRRFTKILPWLILFRNAIQPKGHIEVPLQQQLSRRGSSTKNSTSGAQTTHIIETYRSLDNVHDWARDALSRPSVIHFLTYGTHLAEGNTIPQTVSKSTLPQDTNGGDRLATTLKSDHLLKRDNAQNVRQPHDSDSDVPACMELPPEGAEDEMDDSDLEFFDAEEYDEAANPVTVALERQDSRGVGVLRNSSITVGGVDHIDLSGFERSDNLNDASVQHRWGEPLDREWKVRGPNYFNDKAKVPSTAPFGKLLNVDALYTEKEVVNINAHPRSNYAYFRKQLGPEPFLVTINFCCGSMQVVNLFQIERDRFGRIPKILKKFCEMSDEEKNQRVKLIVFCVDGPWIVRSAVSGGKPAIVSKQLQCSYFVTENSLEISLNVFSHSATKRMVSLIIGACKKVVIDLGFLIEATEAIHLPEQVLGVVRFIRGDLSNLRPL